MSKAHDHGDGARNEHGYPLLIDGCPRCEEHADLGGLAFDATRFERAWRMMLAVDHGDDSFGPHSGYASAADYRLGQGFHRQALLMERYMGIDPWRWPPTPTDLAAGIRGAHRDGLAAGIEKGIRAYAWMKDGTYYVGTTGTTLAAALADAEAGTYP